MESEEPSSSKSRKRPQETPEESEEPTEESSPDPKKTREVGANECTSDKPSSADEEKKCAEKIAKKAAAELKKASSKIERALGTLDSAQPLDAEQQKIENEKNERDLKELSELAEPYTCSICRRLFDNPHSTMCGHTFCYQCIDVALKKNRVCPNCGHPVGDYRANGSGPPGLIVNHQVAEITKHIAVKQRIISILNQKKSISVKDRTQFIEHVLKQNFNDIQMKLLIEELKNFREKNIGAHAEVRNRVLGMFLNHYYWRKHLDLRMMHDTVSTLKGDAIEMGIDLPHQSLPERPQFPPPPPVPKNREDRKPGYKREETPPPQELEQYYNRIGFVAGHANGMDTMACLEILGADLKETLATADDESPMMYERKLAMRTLRHYKALGTAYDNIRIDGTVYWDFKPQIDPLNRVMKEGCDPEYDPKNVIQPYIEDDHRMELFEKYYDGITKFGGAHKIGELNYDIEPQSQMSIVSSLEFNRDGEMFVVAGVSKKIKVFNFDSIMENPHSVHVPVTQLHCTSKISSVSWNPFYREILACTDYDGVVCLWDVRTSWPRRKLQEHTKRCWSVSFNNLDPNVLASASDDGKVKIWSAQCSSSTITIDTQVNVCSVAFSPANAFTLAFGSADHDVHIYDIRQPFRPYTILKGHDKAVSYVRWLNKAEIVSASTDNTLRLWDMQYGQCVKILRGHVNEKNFVGLSSSGDHIVCGSENNQAYFYYKSFANPLFAYDMGTATSHAPCYETQRQTNMIGQRRDLPSRRARMANDNTDPDTTGVNANFIGATIRRQPRTPSPASEGSEDEFTGPYAADARYQAQRIREQREFEARRQEYVANMPFQMPIVETRGNSPAVGEEVSVNVSVAAAAAVATNAQPIRSAVMPQENVSRVFRSVNLVRSLRREIEHSNREIVGVAPDTRGFVSSVTWRPRTNTVLVANSHGRVSILRVD